MATRTTSGLDLHGITSGTPQQGHRLEFELVIDIPDRIKDNIPAMNEWTKIFLPFHLKDIKHVYPWKCQVCEKPARETHLDWEFVQRNSKTIIILFVHFLCEADWSSSCFVSIQRQIVSASIRSGRPRPPCPSLPKDPDIDEYPLAGTCAGCQRSETIADVGLQRCSGCKLIRYCSRECQNSDWRRHKQFCKSMKEANWKTWSDPPVGSHWTQFLLECEIPPAA